MESTGTLCLALLHALCTALTFRPKVLPCPAQVLGGQVQELVEAWKVQRLYAGIDRPKGAGDDNEMAPPFRHFIPGGSRKASGTGAWNKAGMAAPTRLSAGDDSEVALPCRHVISPLCVKRTARGPVCY